MPAFAYKTGKLLRTDLKGRSASAYDVSGTLLRVSRDREHGFQRIVSNDFRGS